jgi:hypothetical protein
MYEKSLIEAITKVPTREEIERQRLSNFNSYFKVRSNQEIQQL